MTSGWQGVLSNVNLNFGVSGPLSCSQTTLCSTYSMLTRLPKGWAFTWPPIRPAYHMKSGFDYHELNLESVHLCPSCPGDRVKKARSQRSGKKEAHRGPQGRLCSAAPLHLVFTEVPENAVDEQLCWWTMHWCSFQIHPLPTINTQTTSQYMNTRAPTYSSKLEVETKCGSLSKPYWFRKVAAHCPSSFSLANTEWLWNIPYGTLQHSNYVPVRCCKELVLSDEGPWCI